MRVIDDNGRELNADYSVEREGEFLSLLLESSGGRTSPGRPPRNNEYRPALELLLARLAEHGATLEDALVDSRHTRGMPEQERRLIDRPIVLSVQSDFEALRRRLSTAQASIGQAPGATKGGNASKRIRLRLSVPGYGTGEAARLATHLASPVTGDDRVVRATVNEWWAGEPAEHFWMEITDRPDVGNNLIAPQLDGGGRPTPPPRTQAPRRARSGAGYIADPVLRRAIETHAVRCALELYTDYDVTDVGATESYDLRAVKEAEEIHVEVKGSTGTADTVELTTNEVQHAHGHRTDLVVVDRITWTRRPDGTIETEGGRRRHWAGWRPSDADLNPTRYRYRLPD